MILISSSSPSTITIEQVLEQFQVSVIRKRIGCPRSFSIPNFSTDDTTEALLISGYDIHQRLQSDLGLILLQFWGESIYWPKDPYETAHTIRRLFPGSSTLTTPDPVSAEERFTTVLQPVLLRGLIELCKTRPADPIRYDTTPHPTPGGSGNSYSANQTHTLARCLGTSVVAVGRRPPAIFRSAPFEWLVVRYFFHWRPDV